MDVVAARRVIQALADGVDPSSGEPVAPDSVLETPAVIRALHTALAALDAQIRPGLRAEEAGGERPAKAGRPWHFEDDCALAAAFDAREPIASIAQALGRTEDAIAARLVRIGRVPDRESARQALSRHREADDVL